MRTTTITAVLILMLATPLEAAGRSSRSTPGFYQAAKRFIIRVLSRVSPPVGSPTVTPEEDTTTSTTDQPTTKTQ